MKFIIFVYITCKILSADIYTIQLMSYSNDSSLSFSFMKKIQNTGLQYYIFKEDSYKKIVLGKFGSRDVANYVSKTLNLFPDDRFVRIYPQKQSKTECQKESCNSIKNHTDRRVCEIKESLAYLRNSGYYHFSSY